MPVPKPTMKALTPGARAPRLSSALLILHSQQGLVSEPLLQSTSERQCMPLLYQVHPTVASHVLWLVFDKALHVAELGRHRDVHGEIVAVSEFASPSVTNRM